MKVIRTLRPGGHGTRKFVREWGEKLIAVRYRELPARQKTLTTIEIVVDERDAMPGFSQHAYNAEKETKIVALRIGYEELRLRKEIRRRGAVWSPQLKLWLLRYKTVVAMGLKDRVVEGAAEKCTDIDISLV